MIIGIPKEIKQNEFRVGATPDGVYELVHNGHKVLVQTNAGKEIGFSDSDYQKSGAEILNSAQEIFKQSDMIVKVKEPQPEEIKMLRKDQILFTYLHLAPDAKQTKGLMESGCIAIAYETVTDALGKLPLLAPMSEIAGRMSIQVGANLLQKNEQYGKGKLIGGAPGVEPAKIVILGGGNVGENAARIAMGMGAKTVIVDGWIPRLKELDQVYGPNLKTIMSSKANILKHIKQADVIVGAALVPGANAPKLITKEMLKEMEEGTVLVDVSIDQGGCFETSKPTTHAKPTYVVDGVIHYCVANMPGALAKTATQSLTNATLPFVVKLANHGWKEACLKDPNLKNGLNIIKGECVYQEVAEAQNINFIEPEKLL